MIASARMPWSVRVTLVLALLMVGLPLGFLALYDTCEHFWPWDRDPAHVVVHVQNDSPSVVSVQYDSATRRFIHRPSALSGVASGEVAHDTLVQVPARQQLACYIEVASTPGASPIAATLTVSPDEHLLFTVDRGGAVTLSRGRESWFGYPVFGQAVAVSGSAP